MSNVIRASNESLISELRFAGNVKSIDPVTRDLLRRAREALELTPIEKLLVEWWSTDMDNAELFNRAVRLNPALADAINALPEKNP